MRYPAYRPSILAGDAKHAGCGGAVTRPPSFVQLDILTCEACGQSWGDYQIDRFTDAELGERFYIDADLGFGFDEGLVLCWVEDEGKRFTSLVPVSMAGGLEKVST